MWSYWIIPSKSIGAFCLDFLLCFTSMLKLLYKSLTFLATFILTCCSVWLLSCIKSFLPFYVLAGWCVCAYWFLHYLCTDVQMWSIHPWSQNPTNWSYPGDFFLALELSRNLSWLAGPPVNVSCNIFINSFGSIAETTMVSESKHKLLFPARDISLPEISTLCAGLPQGGGKSGVFSRLQWYTGHFYCPSQCFG